MASHITMTALSFLVACTILQTFCHAMPLHSGEMGLNHQDRNHTGLEGRNGSGWGDRRPGPHGSMARRLGIVLEILRMQQGPSRMDNDTMPRHNKTRDMDGNSTCEEWRYELMQRLGRLAKRQIHARDEEHKRPSESHDRPRPDDAKPDREEMPSLCRQSRELLRLLRHAVLGKNCLPRGEHNGSFERDNMTRGEWNHTRGPKDDVVNGTRQHGAGSRGARKWEQEVFRLLVDLAMRKPGHQRRRDDEDNESERLNGTRPEGRNCTDDDDEDDDNADDVNDDNERLDGSRPEWRERLVRILRRLVSRGRRGGEGSRRTNGELRGERTEHSNERQRSVGGRRGERTRPGGESGDESERPAGGRREKRHAGGPRGDRTRPTGETSNERTRPTGERTRPTGEPRHELGEGRRRGPGGEDGDERPRPAGGQRGDRTRPTGEPSNERTKPTGDRTRPTGEPRDGLGEGRQRGPGGRRGGGRGDSRG